MMRGVELALSLLLVSGISKALPQYGPGTDGVGPEEVTATGCPAYTHDCVPYYQCIDGEINTSGAGLIDVRIKPQTECTNPEYPEVPGICCRIPGATVPPTPAPVQTCPGNLVCVEQGQCNSDGSVNTDGAGLINTRFYTTCYVDPATYLTGVCCQPPTPAPLVTCPGYQVCRAEGQCSGVGAVGTGASYNSCYLDQANYVTGVCCDLPVYDVCPGDSVCLPEILCQGDILDISENFVPYGNAGTWSQCSLSGDVQSPGVCCRNPVVTPAPLDTCPGYQACVGEGQCTGVGVGGTYTSCHLDKANYVTGVCCDPVVTEPPYNPYTAAIKCGVRNYGLDVRTQVKLAKNEAQFGEFPWQAVLFFSNYTFKCGASLVEDRWLITGAHCVHGHQYGDFKVRLGEWQVDKYDEPLKYVDVDIASIAIHPNFNPSNLHNDVAVIELTAPILLQYHINTVCLPSTGQLPVPGTRCFATGWGKDAFTGNYQAILKKVDVPYVESAYCQNLLRQTRLGKYFQLDQSFLCAGGEENVDACTGDGGGPLVCQDPNSGSYLLQGITAWGINCGQKDVPGVYVDVQFFRDWINGIIYDAPVDTSVNPYGRK